MGSHQPIRKIVTPEIPDKLYFRIGDVAKLLDVPAYVLRFWETEFPQLKPNKGGTGQRLYRKRDVEMALRVKSLLYDQGFTIPGARQILKAEARGSAATDVAPAEISASPRTLEVAPPVSGRSASQMQSIRNELQALLGILSHPAGSGHSSSAKVKTMRPRLAIEPRLVPVAPAATARPEAVRPALQLAQRDLFAAEPTDAAEPEPNIPA